MCPAVAIKNIAEWLAAVHVSLFEPKWCLKDLNSYDLSKLIICNLITKCMYRLDKQSRLLEPTETKIITCASCGAQDKCKIIKQYLDTDTVYDPRMGKAGYPDIALIECHTCHIKSVICNEYYYAPTHIDNEDEYPENIVDNYKEMMMNLNTNSYTSCAMMCRRILMLIAIDLGATKNKKFEYYVKYLENRGYVTPQMKRWVDNIRKIGNDANHNYESVLERHAMFSPMFIVALITKIYAMKYAYLDADLDGYCGL